MNPARLVTRVRIWADCHLWDDPVWRRIHRESEAEMARMRGNARASDMRHISELVDDEIDRLWPDDPPPSR